MRQQQRKTAVLHSPFRDAELLWLLQTAPDFWIPSTASEFQRTTGDLDGTLIGLVNSLKDAKIGDAAIYPWGDTSRLE